MYVYNSTMEFEISDEMNEISDDNEISDGNEMNDISDNNEMNKISDDNEISDNEEQGDASCEESAEEHESKSQSNPAWADALSKVLRTNISKKKHFILSKAKKDCDILINKTVDPSVEIVNDSGLIIEPTKKSDNKEKQSAASIKKKENVEKQQKKYVWENMCRLKPDLINKEKERMLIRVATKGVVHLFNAVEKHQKSQNSPNKSEAKKRKSLASTKGNFMDMLKGNVHQSVKVETNPEESSKKESWSALKEDFMMGASLKDWDKGSDEDDKK